ncbi:ABC transporter substrate-binding protein [Paenibacillus alba]|uniref:Extracellular solute-binding protein n=1 Tax=Paenibacillus alba TaxID=1197127 RepID=A0ABU6FUU2_9BACL|nr:extracellular solute-binding protein [Paenibacillus alba]MEC0225651.1 extracellular solute-binding protein [Paenibacillus alba]
MLNVKYIGKKGLALCFLAFAIALSACSSGASTPTSGSADNSPSGEQGSDGKKSGSNVITISVVTSNRFLELAKKKYEAANPGVTIELKPSYIAPKPKDGAMTPTRASGYDPAAVEKHVATVNAELMNGNASDLIMVDTLAYTKYADKKLLVDLQAYMNKEKDFNENNYYMNIFDALKYKKGLYAITPSVVADIWFGNSDRIKDLKLDPNSWTWNQFSQKLGDLAKKGGDPVVEYTPPEYFTSKRVSENIDKFMKLDEKKANFKSPEFTSLLNEIKSYYDKKILQEPKSNGNKGMTSGGSAGFKEAFINLKLQNFDSLSFGKRLFANPQVFMPPTENGSKGNSFNVGMLLAMNEKSKNKDRAWDFLKFLLSEKMQSERDLGGLPVNKKTAEAQISTLETAGENKLSPDEVGKAKEIMPQLKRYGGMEPKINDIVMEETGLFFKGEKTAEDVAKTLQNRVTLYMEE